MFTHPLTADAELRPLETWQAAEFAAATAKAVEHFAPWLPWAERVAADEAGAKAFLQRYADRHAADDGHIFGIWLDGELVGGALFRRFEVGQGVAELGVWLSPEAGGRGLVTLACRYLIDWAFHTRGLRRVEWLNTVDNTRSAATAARLGMSLDGVLRQAFTYRGATHDVQIWSVLSSEWPR